MYVDCNDNQLTATKTNSSDSEQFPPPLSLPPSLSHTHTYTCTHICIHQGSKYSTSIASLVKSSRGTCVTSTTHCSQCPAYEGSTVSSTQSTVSVWVLAQHIFASQPSTLCSLSFWGNNNNNDNDNNNIMVTK